MQPVGRTGRFNRGCVVNDLAEVKGGKAKGLKVEIAAAPNFFPAGQDFHRLSSEDASLVGRDDLVLNAAPGDPATEQ